MSTPNKIAVISGASQGTGAGLVKACRDRGIRMVANSRSIRPSDDPHVVTVPCDIADHAVAERAPAGHAGRGAGQDAGGGVAEGQSGLASTDTDTIVQWTPILRGAHCPEGDVGREGTEMERSLSRLIDALPGLVWTALPDGRADFVNQRWCEYTGKSVEECLKG